MYDVTLFENFSNAIGDYALGVMLDGIKNGTYRLPIESLRKLIHNGDYKGYDLAKRKLPAFTPCARYKRGRKLEYMTGYNAAVVLDFDKLTPEELIRVKMIICMCDYTLACFVSPSGNGLKVLVRVNTGIEEHKRAFLSVQQFYMTLTGIAIDPSGKDVTRLCFVSWDPELYFNPQATIFQPIIGEGQIWPEAGPDKPNDVPTWATRRPVSTGEPSGIIETYNRCINYVERHCSFTEGHRNEFVFALSLQLRRAGMPDGLTLMMMLQDYNFDEREVRSCVKSAYSYVWKDETVNKDNVIGADYKSAPAEPAEIVNVTTGADLQSAPNENTTPPKKEKSPGRRYRIKKVEALLSQWYQTRYNEVTGLIEWCHVKTKELFKRLDDYDENSMHRRLHHAEQPIPTNALHTLLYSDFSPDFNPFIAYRDSLNKWDGETDYIQQLSDTVKTEDDTYWSFCFRKWFVAYAASLVCDEVINHTVIVFVGKQGVGKTRWMKRLVPTALKNYLGTAALQTDSKDTAIQTSECALIMLDEMETLNRKDLASFKELITRPEIRIRRPYGRNSENLPHRASFIAAVNYQQILTDQSGSRRYLCSLTISLDYEHEIDLDCAMAQAFALYESGFRFWFDQEEIRELTDRNEVFLSKPIEEELIGTWLRAVTRAEWDSKNKFMTGASIQLMTAADIAIKLTEKSKQNLGDNTSVKIGKIMNKLGFERVRKHNNYYYMVRVVDGDTVERDSRTLDEIQPVQKDEQAENEQIIRLEEDLSKSSQDDELPF